MREAAQREKNERMAVEGRSAAMRATGTKKRKKVRGTGGRAVDAGDDADGEGEVEDGAKDAKRRKSSPPSMEVDVVVQRDSSAFVFSSGSDSEELGVDAMLDKNTSSGPPPPKKKLKSRPKPRPRYKATRETSEEPAAPSSPRTVVASRPSSIAGSDSDEGVQARKPKTKARIVFSDEDE